MKHLLLLFLLGLNSVAAQAQLVLGISDTILYQTFSVDPSDTMLLFPSGNDLQWVNWDADVLATECGSNEPVPGNWYWESDLGDPNNPPLNSAFTSCSWLEDNNAPNQNWLITPPVFIPDPTTVLFWRSLSFEGPGYLDGYKVLVSTSTNEPFTGAFTDTLFVAAEMVKALVNGSLDPDDYLFSPGYVHANWYSDTAYYFLVSPSAYSYHGRLEPHTASLSAYAGQWIYIAFLHDSTNDNILQVDDITVIHNFTSAVQAPGTTDYFLQVRPNPVREIALVSWQANSQEPGVLFLSNLMGETVFEQTVLNLGRGSAQLNIGYLPAGIYSCTLRSTRGCQTVLLVKQ